MALPGMLGVRLYQAGRSMTDTCTASCLRATTKPDRCRCTCEGRLHGAARDEDAYVDALVDGRRRGLHHLSDLDILAGAWI